MTRNLSVRLFAAALVLTSPAGVGTGPLKDCRLTDRVLFQFTLTQSYGEDVGQAKHTNYLAHSDARGLIVLEPLSGLDALQHSSPLTIEYRRDRQLFPGAWNSAELRTSAAGYIGSTEPSAACLNEMTTRASDSLAYTLQGAMIPWTSGPTEADISISNPHSEEVGEHAEGKGTIGTTGNAGR
ncbi:MAG TPA: hypothetical protein VL588_06205 [Bdellovibrionota bacterium]|nr:hypothetical protein [Bdellovibrionota bacterium]